MGQIGQMAHLLSVIFTVFIDPRLMQSQFCHNMPVGRIVHSIERSTCKEMYSVKAERVVYFARREGVRSSETNLSVNCGQWWIHYTADPPGDRADERSRRYNFS